MHCNCQVRCRGGKNVSKKTYLRHTQYRNEFSAEFSAFMATALHGSEEASLPSFMTANHEQNQVTPNDDDLDISRLFGGNEGLEDVGVNRDDGAGVDNWVPYEPHIPLQEEDSNVLSNSINQTLATPQVPDASCALDQNHAENHSHETEMDPGSLAMDVDEPQAMASDPPGSTLNLNELFESATLETIKIALEYIRELKKASLDDGHLAPNDLERLQNPPSSPVDLTPDQRVSLELFVSTQNATQQVYTSIKKVIERRYSDSHILTYDQAKQLTAEISGVSHITDHMCINSCVAYTGPFSALETCPICTEPRFDPHHQPRRVFNTIPIGPQLQALKRDRKNAMALRYRALHTKAVLSELQVNGGVIRNYSDFFNGSHYLDAVEGGLIQEDDIVLMLSLDGAQLFMSKQSDCWICIWVVFDHSPDIRYKKMQVLPAFAIPGPNPPRLMDSFLYRSLQHLVALQRDGLRIWDASKEAVVTCYPFFALGTADGPGLTHLNGLVGHMGKNGCRMYCGIRGRRKPRDSHYYPALLKPSPPYNVEGSNHPDSNFEDSRTLTPSVEKYQAHLRLLVSSRNETNYKANRLETGIVKPSIFLALDEKHSLPVPQCFGSDIMHHGSLNIPDLLIPLWRGTFDCAATDKRSTWDWVVLTGNTWAEHGQAVAAATPYLPGSFDRPPRNPALKISSGYKAWEFLMYLYGLGPGIFYNVLPTPYYQNFCDLVYGIRIINQHTISCEQLLQARDALYRFAQEFEELYYQRRTDRLHFIRQSIHQCYHLALEVTRVGPPVISSQWTMERTIGNLTQELRQPSNPYANLAQRALLRCQINALKNIIPDLEESNDSLPRGAIALGNEYILLRRRDRTARPVLPCEELALASYFQKSPEFCGVSFSSFAAIRWGRLRLPNGQIARSLWVEESKTIYQVRMARNVKIVQDIGAAVEIAEVRFYFRISMNSIEHTLAFVSCYSPPHSGLLKASRGTLWSCTRVESVKVVDVKHISAVVAMVPHQPFPGEEGESRFFLVEKPGLDTSSVGGIDEMDVD